jgi:ferredoxin-NADP reductase
MTTRDVYQDIEGYPTIQREIEVLRKYGRDYSADKGRVTEIIDMLHPKGLALKVAEVRQECASSKTFRLVPEGGYLPPFQAGQYITLFVEIDGVKTSRPYSLTSPPNRTAFYTITVKRVEEGFVSPFLLDTITVGDRLTSTSPTGNFFHNPLIHGNDLVFLAGGSGITPFMSIIRECIDRALDRRISLIYGSEDPEDILFKDDLANLAEGHDNVRVHHVISSPPAGYAGRKGFISAELMSGLLDDIPLKTFYLCGPRAMYDFCLMELEKMGVPKKRIRTEVPGPPPDVALLPGWPEEVKPDDRFTVRLKGDTSIEAKAGEPLIVSFERAGITLKSSCRSGECSLCRVKLVSGRVFQPPGVRVRKSDRRFGYIHACAAYPLSDLEVLV